LVYFHYEMYIKYIKKQKKCWTIYLLHFHNKKPMACTNIFI
jgi:hypothetical protein